MLDAGSWMLEMDTVDDGYVSDPVSSALNAMRKNQTTS